MADDVEVLHRRNVAATIAGVTPAQGEMGWITDEKVPFWGDGARTGGFKGMTFSTWQAQKYIYATAGGTADAVTVTLSPAPLTRVAGLSFAFKAASNNTGAMTLDDGTGSGAAAVKKAAGGALADPEADDVVAGGVYRVTWTGSVWFLEGGVGGGGGGGLELLQEETIGAAVASLDLDAGDWTQFRAIRLRGWGINCSSNTRAIRFRVLQGGSPVAGGHDLSTEGGTNANGQSHWGSQAFANTPEKINFEIVLLRPGGSQAIKGGALWVAGGDSATSGKTDGLTGVLIFDGNGNAIEGIQVDFSAGNIEAGEFVVEGEPL